MKPGSQVTIKMTDGTYIKRAEVINISSGKGMFLNFDNLKVIELTDFELFKYGSIKFDEFCKCENPKIIPHPNNQDLLCENCNKKVKI